jgi:hypothetical protein
VKAASNETGNKEKKGKKKWQPTVARMKVGRKTTKRQTSKEDATEDKFNCRHL